MSDQSPLLSWCEKYQKTRFKIFPVHTPDENGICSCSEGANCTSTGKHPRTKNGVRDARNDLNVIKEWWTRWPDANIGIATGASSGIIVVDVDFRHGGEESFNKFKWNEIQTLSVKTGNGFHLYYKYHESLAWIKSGVQTLGLGVDIRSNGGYVVAPPSRHKNGEQYFWTNDFSVDKIDPFPKVFIDILKESRFESSSRSNGQKESLQYIEGNRNTHLTSLAGTMRARGMSFESIHAALLTENKNCVPPLTDREVETIARSVARYQEDAPVIIEADLDLELQLITSDNRRETTDKILKILLSKDNRTREDVIQKLHLKTGYTLSGLRKDFRNLEKDDKNLKKQQRIESLSSSIERAVAILSDKIIVPIDPTTNNVIIKEVMIRTETENGERVERFWGTQGTPTPTVQYEIMKLIGDSDDESDARIIREKLALAVHSDQIQNRCRIEYGPILKGERFFTKTDIDAGIVIMSGDHLITKSQEPERNDIAFEHWKRLFAENWQDILSHIITALVGETPRNKHILCITGSSGSGKSTVGEWISRTIEGFANVIVASNLEGNWPAVFKSRSPILDNLDNRSLKTENQDTLTSALSSERTTVPARYTMSGLSASLGYPIVTSIHSDIMDHYKALKSRTIQISQNFSEEIWNLVDRAESIIDQARPHIWYLIEEFVNAIRENTIPAIPGKFRLTGFARARWWVAVHLENANDAEAEEICERYKMDDSDDESRSSLATLIQRAFGEYGEHNFPRNCTATEIMAIINKYMDETEISKVKVSKHETLTDSKKQGIALRKLIERERVANKIGDYTFYDFYDSQKKRKYFTISKISSQIPQAPPICAEHSAANK